MIRLIILGILITSASVMSLPDASVDSLTAKPDSVKARPDSLTQGKKADSSLTLLGRHGLGASASFFIGIVPAFTRLRSTSENANVANSMAQDPQGKFDDNDIAWPLGAVYRFRLGKNIKLGADAAFYRIANSATWMPNAGDTVHVRNYVNGYSLNVARISFCAQFDIDPLVFSVDNFQRCYIVVEGELSPAWFSTERTELDGRVRAFGLGYGGSMSAGVERYLNERVSLSGEIGYGIVLFPSFSDRGRVKTGDVLLGNSAEAYSIMVRHLAFRIAVCRWF